MSGLRSLVRNESQRPLISFLMTCVSTYDFDSTNDSSSSTTKLLDVLEDVAGQPGDHGGLDLGWDRAV